MSKPVLSSARKSKPQQPIVGIEVVTCACGHKADFPLFHPKADSFRDARRMKLVGRACTPCRQEAHARRTAEAQAAKALRPKKPRRWQSRRKENPISRLPDTSEFRATYDATTMTWTGTLTVPSNDPLGIDSTTFTETAGGIKPLLFGLDARYRAALPAVQERDEER